MSTAGTEAENGGGASSGILSDCLALGRRDEVLSRVDKSHHPFVDPLVGGTDPDNQESPPRTPHTHLPMTSGHRPMVLRKGRIPSQTYDRLKDLITYLVLRTCVLGAILGNHKDFFTTTLLATLDEGKKAYVNLTNQQHSMVRNELTQGFVEHRELAVERHIIRVPGVVRVSGRVVDVLPSRPSRRRWGSVEWWAVVGMRRA
ncbi:hypothetical protein HOY82DRAFT_617098 [Tuber indicum]|nr:hypothetical protein HOY82DRAFT_617098 [Tuber indicum]